MEVEPQYSWYYEKLKPSILRNRKDHIYMFKIKGKLIQ